MLTSKLMLESIIVPTLDPSYDLTYLTPLQQFILPYEFWMELGLWIIFGGMLIWKSYQYLVLPYLEHDTHKT